MQENLKKLEQIVGITYKKVQLVLNSSYFEAYTTSENISYIAEAQGLRAFFPTDDHYTKHWFYPRYGNGKLHEPVLTNLLLKHLDCNSIFIDVGAHIGYFSVLAGSSIREQHALEIH